MWPHFWMWNALATAVIAGLAPWFVRRVRRPLGIVLLLVAVISALWYEVFVAQLEQQSPSTIVYRLDLFVLIPAWGIALILNVFAIYAGSRRWRDAPLLRVLFSSR